MNWINLSDLNQLEEINLQSQEQKVLIFKHSTRCSISAAALSRLERNWPADSTHKIYFLDLLSYRAISDRIAEKFSTVHQSTQVLIISKGNCIYTSSHFEINAPEVLDALT